MLAAGLGALLGIERELRLKAAGLRTNILIAIGSALFTILSIELVAGRNGDPSRIAAQIVTGIGFLGGGAILRREGSVQGLTTAATIWANAGVGMAAGAGRYQLAVVASVTALVVLIALSPVDRYIEERERLRRARESGSVPVVTDSDRPSG